MCSMVAWRCKRGYDESVVILTGPDRAEVGALHAHRIYLPDCCGCCERCCAGECPGPCASIAAQWSATNCHSPPAKVATLSNSQLPAQSCRATSPNSIIAARRGQWKSDTIKPPLRVSPMRQKGAVKL